MPIPYPPQLVQIMKARNGVAPVCLLDILTVGGEVFYWGQLGMLAPPVLLPASATAGPVEYLPYLINIGAFHFLRSMQADLGSLDAQNLSGDTLARDVATAITQQTFENALYVLREWYPEGECAGFEMHGRLSVDGVSESEAPLDCIQLFNPSAYETPQYVDSETCQWRYGSTPCGADGTNPCDNTYTTCRVPERVFGILNTFTFDMTPSYALASSKLVNRVRQI